MTKEEILEKYTGITPDSLSATSEIYKAMDEFAKEWQRKYHSVKYLLKLQYFEYMRNKYLGISVSVIESMWAEYCKKKNI